MLDSVSLKFLEFDSKVQGESFVKFLHLKCLAAASEGCAWHNHSSNTHLWDPPEISGTANARS